MNIVPELLNEDNYVDWRVRVKTYLEATDVWDVIEEEEADDDHNLDQNKSWRKKNAKALYAIHLSCGQDAFFLIRHTTSAKSAWETLEQKYDDQADDDLSSSSITSDDGDPAIELDSGQETENSPYEPEESYDIPAEYESFYMIIVRGDWNAAKIFIEQHPDAITARINPLGETALHVAVAYCHVGLVKELLNRMSEKDLETRQNQGYTALSLAAMTGIIPMAKHLINKNKELARIPGHDGLLPVVRAMFVGHSNMARYLYFYTKLEDLKKNKSLNGASLLNLSIMSQNFDIALDLITRCQRFTIAKSAYSTLPSLVTMAICNSASPSGSHLNFWQKWIYKCIQIQMKSVTCSDPRVSVSEDSATNNDTRIKISGGLDKDTDASVKKDTVLVLGLRGIGSYLCELLGIKKMYELKLVHVQSQELLRSILDSLKTLMSEDKQRITDIAHQAMFRAVEEGHVELVIEISKAIPELIRYTDHSQRTLFSYAVECRQPEIFSLIHDFVILKEEIAAVVDDSGNTVLHVAGKLAPSSNLSRISGAALQMQRELQWFKEVEAIMKNKMIKEYKKNGKGMTPREFFTKNHKELLKDGEKWMKETASSCTFVAALIVTIMFAAAFVIPGGNEQEKKLSIVSHEKWFLIFIISDAISLFSSTTSVLMFLGILTSRYYEDAFLWSLPTKLIIGLSALFFSIATMMISFCAALYVMLQGKLTLLIPVILFASVPVTLFVRLQFPLLVEIFVSTYGSGIFTRKYKNSPLR